MTKNDQKKKKLKPAMSDKAIEKMILRNINEARAALEKTPKRFKEGDGIEEMPDDGAID